MENLYQSIGLILQNPFSIASPLVPEAATLDRSTFQDPPSSATIAADMAGDTVIHERDDVDEDFLNVSSDGIPLEEPADADDIELTPNLDIDKRENKNKAEIKGGYSESDDESEEIDPTPLDYARMNGLARNYLAEKYAEVEAIQQDTVLDLLPDSHIPQFKLGEEIKVEERISVSKDGATLLASIARAETVEIIDALIIPMLEPKKNIATLKLELPLLRSHHKTDCKNFGKREGFEIRLRDVKLPLEAVNEEAGQGLGLPARFWDIGPQVLEQLKAEKINISKDGLSCLQESLKVVWTKEDSQGLWNSEVKYNRVWP